MDRQECAGLRILRNTLEPVRSNEVASIPERGDYRQIESWDGSISVEITDNCNMSDRACLLIAEALANDQMPRSVFVSDWKIEQQSRVIILTPLKWDESDVDSGLRIQ